MLQKERTLKKLYVLYLEWCENNDDGKEILMVTSDYERAREEFEGLVVEFAKNYSHWTIADNTLTKFYCHGTFPEHVELRILEYFDGQRGE